MTKKIIVTGINGRFDGFVKVLMNAGTEEKSTHNPSTHDDVTKRIPYHTVKGFACGAPVDETKFYEEDQVEIKANGIESLVRKVLNSKANDKININKTTETLKRLGYE